MAWPGKVFKELSSSEWEYDLLLSQIASELECIRPELEETETQRNAAKEAFQQGQSIDRKLEDLTELLWETREAGFLDLLGVPIIGDYLKYKKFKLAKRQISEFQDTLNEYIKELQTNSFELAVPDQPSISSATQFSDYLFDGIAMDGFVLSKIQKSLDAYNRLHKRVQWIQEQLESVIMNLNAELELKHQRIIELAQLETEN